MARDAEDRTKMEAIGTEGRGRVLKNFPEHEQT